jgi:[acyl-carrier-protein] S-malonyltransferase
LCNIFLYPGQGSQSIGMGRDLYENYPLAHRRYAVAADILGFDLGKLCFNGSENELKQTRVTQPALYVHSCILSELFRERGVNPHAAAGHSLGEYSALHAADAFSFEDGLRLVKLRAEAMQQAGEINPGSMAAIIGLDDAGVQELCDSVSDVGVVVPANINSPGQIVVSGDKAAIEKLVATAKSMGARMAKQLAVSGAFHSPLMRPAAYKLADALAAVEIRTPAFPVMSNVTARTHGNPDDIRRLLANQLLSPVRWSDCMLELAKLENATWFEIGSGSVLSGLLKRTIEGAAAAAIDGVDALLKFQNPTGASE